MLDSQPSSTSIRVGSVFELIGLVPECVDVTSILLILEDNLHFLSLEKVCLPANLLMGRENEVCVS